MAFKINSNTSISNTPSVDYNLISNTNNMISFAAIPINDPNHRAYNSWNVHSAYVNVVDNKLYIRDDGVFGS